MSVSDAELARLDADRRRTANWKRWGPYLAERQWGTVREDYSASGDAWSYFPHDQARSRAYRWGEDGLLGICDRQGRMCFALALWNHRDPILKERLFGLAGPEGNHGEDVKELYYYLDSTPTHSYMKALYRYPQAAFPYARLREENSRRGRGDREFELADTGVLDDGRFFDVTAEYAKAAPEDILIRLTLDNRGPESAPLVLLPTLWVRNTWSWGRHSEGYWKRPRLSADAAGRVLAEHDGLGAMVLTADTEPGEPQLLFTENETNFERLFGGTNQSPYTKDAFHDFVVSGRTDVVNPALTGTKAAFSYSLQVPAGAQLTVRLRLSAVELASDRPFADFDAVFAARRREADGFYARFQPLDLTTDERRVDRQAYAGLLWSKQFYTYVVRDWLEGDPAQPRPPADRQTGRNSSWQHLYNRDVISMPDKWEYPWYAAWDLAFHCIPLARVDPDFAKGQLELFLREWYMHPNGQLPAYEYAFGDVNPPVHAWAAWRIYKMTGPRHGRDRVFLSHCFQKLLINFTWWVNRKDLNGNNLFSGGFLGLDNIGVFDRSRPLPTGGYLHQADATAWMAFYCSTMLSMGLELAREDPASADLASKFLEHFVAIADATNQLGDHGLWDEEDGFYYDQIRLPNRTIPLRVRSLVGLLPLLAVEVLEDAQLERHPNFRKRLEWFLRNRGDLADSIAWMATDRGGGHRLLAIPSRDRMTRLLGYMLDESEFLSPYGIRSLSRVHQDQPYVFEVDGQEHRVGYEPAESQSGMFGGNSNWRGPIWLPINYLLIEALERYHHFYGDELQVECPTGSGQIMNLWQVARELDRRLVRLFLADENGRRPCLSGDLSAASEPSMVLFHEYFDGDTGRGLGASHQTGWTSLIVRSLEKLARERARPTERPTKLPG